MGVLTHMIQERGLLHLFDIDSAGTIGYHSVSQGVMVSISGALKVICELDHSPRVVARP